MRAHGLLGCAVGALAVLGALTACTSNPVGVVATRVPTSTAPTPSTPVTPATPAPTQHAAGASPLAVRCRLLVPTALAAQIAPGMRVEPGWTPPDDSPAAALERLRGTACSWTDDAGDMLQVAAARPSAADAVALKNDLVERSNSVPTYGREAYFRVEDHVGRVDAFRGRTWIVVRSNRFFEPGDAVSVMASVDAALGFEPPSSPSPTPSPSLTPATG